MSKRRPPLSDVLAKSKASPTRAPAKARKPGRRASGAMQVNVLLPAGLRLDVKAAAMRDGRDLSDVVEELLRAWLDKRGKSAGRRAV